MKIRPV